MCLRLPKTEAKRCRSSVVEHPLGKGEVVGSIPTGSTSNQPYLPRISVSASCPKQRNGTRTPATIWHQAGTDVRALFGHALPSSLLCPLLACHG